MRAAEIMTALTSHDTTVVVEQGRVRLLFPEDHRPPAELIEAARANKDALRAILARAGGPVLAYGRVLDKLRAECPALVEPDRWQQAIHDAHSFLATWDARAHTLGWTARELFGLHAVPERPAATYRRLSRYDETGLIWLLQGRPVVALTDTEAVILARSGASLTYRKHNKPAFGPLGDCLDDMVGPNP
jgi:hypothetical protein